MPIRVEFDNEYDNLMVSRIEDPFDPDNDTKYGLLELNKFLAKTEGKVYVISDMRELHPSFSDIMLGMAEASYKKDSPVRNDRVVIAQVADGELFKLMADWFKQEQYGALDLPLFKTVEEARQFLIDRMT